VIRFRLGALVICGLVVLGGPVAAADLAKIDRRLDKEPKYQAKPAYCLLVFGADAKARVWLVKDGGTLYLDRNGNGDLTEDGERLGGAGEKSFGAITAARGTKYEVRQCELTKLETPARKQEDFCHIAIDVAGKFRQYSFAGFASTPKEAPVVHFDGPITIEVSGEDVKLVRGDDPTDLGVYMLTRGLGKRLGSTVLVDYNLGVPADAYPVVEIEYQPADPGGRSVVAHHTLKQRC
jgi:hypothetical protein